MGSKILSYSEFQNRFFELEKPNVSNENLEIDSLDDSVLQFKIGISLVNGLKSIVIRHDDDINSFMPKSMTYENLSVTLGRNELDLGIIYFKKSVNIDQDVELLLLFLLASDYIKYSSLSNSLVKLHELFDEPSEKKAEVIGLIGELLYILNSVDRDSTVAAWHSNINNRYDFSEIGKIVDVKTTFNIDRIHTISKAQLESPGNSKIASVLLAPVEVGDNLISLIETLKIFLNEESNKKLNLILEKMDITKAKSSTDIKFDMKKSISSIKIYESPVFEYNITPGVIDYTVRFNFSEIDRNSTI
jgi:hypothetical protein